MKVKERFSENDYFWITIRLALFAILSLAVSILFNYASIFIMILAAWILFYSPIFRLSSLKALVFSSLIVFIVFTFLAQFLVFLLWAGAYGDVLNPKPIQHLMAIYLSLSIFSILITVFSVIYSIKKKSAFFFSACLALTILFFISILLIGFVNSLL